MADVWLELFSAGETGADSLGEPELGFDFIAGDGADVLFGSVSIRARYVVAILRNVRSKSVALKATTDQ